MCTCIEDLYWAEIRVPLGPTVLLGVGALLVYRLWKFVAAVVEDCDAESVMTGSEDSDEDSGDGDEADDYYETDDAEADEAADAVTSDPEDALFDPSAEDPDVEYPYSAGLTVTPWGLSVPNELFDADPAENPEIFPEDDTVYEVSLIDAPTPGPTPPPTPAPEVISSTEEASSDTAPPLPEIGGTPSESSPPDAV
jgi:hypothetical protein